MYFLGKMAETDIARRCFSSIFFLPGLRLFPSLFPIVSLFDHDVTVCMYLLTFHPLMIDLGWTGLPSFVPGSGGRQNVTTWFASLGCPDWLLHRGGT